MRKIGGRRVRCGDSSSSAFTRQLDINMEPIASRLIWTPEGEILVLLPSGPDTVR